MTELISQPLFWLLAIIGVLFTGISKSGFAGGAGVIAVPLLALVMPVNDAAAIILPLLLIMDGRTVYLYRAHINLKHIMPIIGAAIVGITLAGFAMAWLSTNALQICLAIVCLVFSVWQPLLNFLGKLSGGRYLWGSLSGVSSTLLHAGGPPITIYFLSQNLPKQVWLAQASIFFALMNVIKLIPYSLNQVWKQEYFLINLFLIPIALVGVFLGYQIQRILSEQLFNRCCRYFLMLTGTVLLTKTFL